MTWVDVVVLLVLVLVAVGGYAQGFVRGLVRLLALGVIAVLGWFVAAWAEQGDVVATLQRVGAGLAVMTLLVSIVAWSLLYTVGKQVHANRWNRAFGVVPALAQGLVVVGLLLTLAERLAPEQSTQELIRNGAITQLLIAPFDLLEQFIING